MHQNLITDSESAGVCVCVVFFFLTTSDEIFVLNNSPVEDLFHWSSTLILFLTPAGLDVDWINNVKLIASFEAELHGNQLSSGRALNIHGLLHDDWTKHLRS